MGSLVDYRWLRTKVCLIFSIVSSATHQVTLDWLSWHTRPVSANRFYHLKMVILGGDFFLYLVLNFLWTEVGDCASWNHKQRCTRAAIRLHDDWQDLQAALHEWKAIWRFEWKLENLARLFKYTWPNCYFYFRGYDSRFLSNEFRNAL
jgi:hypothetical protein